MNNSIVTQAQVEKEFVRILRAVLMISALGIVFVFFYAIQFGLVGWLTVFGIGCLTATAALVVGGLLGFLFGIPRTIQQSEPPPNPDDLSVQSISTGGSRRPYSANTNLEDISDWLTKILVGVSLTQIAPIINAMGRLAEFLKPGFGDVNHSSIFAIAVVIHFLVCGFLLGYLWTRSKMILVLQQTDIYVGEMVNTVIIAKREAKDAEDRALELEKHNKLLELASRQISYDGLSEPVPLPQLVNAAKAAPQSTRDMAFILASSIRSTTWKNGKHRMELTIPVFEALVSATEDRKDHRYLANLGYTLKDKRNPTEAELKRAQELLTEAIELRGAPEIHEEYFYELALALLRIQNDPNFTQNKPSDDSAKSQVLEDLRVATQNPTVRGIYQDITIFEEWFKLNKLDITQFAASGVVP